MSTYDEMLASLYAAHRLGVRFELGRVRDALAALGRPDRGLGRVFQVGGTNGKGSTAAFLDALLRRAGLRTALYTSPHLSRFGERIRIDDREATRDELVRAHARVTAATSPELTFFERVTLMAVVLAAEAGVDATVLEVGMGGRLDATTAVDADVSVVTGVALDHQEVLGPDLAAIAAEKAGIFRPGRPAVIGGSGEPEGVALLRDGAQQRGAAPIVVVDAPWPGEVALRGAHQRWNAAAAVAAVSAAGLPVAAEALAGPVRWPGRLESIEALGRRWLLDGAHNPAGARALAAALPAGPFTVIAAVSADKDLAGMLAAIVPRAAQVIATEAPSPRAVPAAALAAAARALGADPVCVPAWQDALAAVAHPEVVVFGSLFLVGAVRAHLLREDTDPLVVQDPAAGRPRT